MKSSFLLFKWHWNNTREIINRIVGNKYHILIKELPLRKYEAEEGVHTRKSGKTIDPLINMCPITKVNSSKVSYRPWKKISTESYSAANEDSKYSCWKVTRKLKRPITETPPTDDVIEHEREITNEKLSKWNFPAKWHLVWCKYTVEEATNPDENIQLVNLREVAEKS